MKKIITIAMAGILTVALLGCSAGSPAAGSPQPEVSAAPEQTQDQSANSAAPEQPQADAPQEQGAEGQQSEADASADAGQDANVQSATGIFGKVKSIVGNEIELEMAEPPFDIGAPSGEEGDEMPGTALQPAQSVTVTVDEKDMPEGAESGDGTKEDVVMGYEGSDGSVVIAGGAGSENKMELKYTGETKNVIIPTGIDIMSVLTGKTAKLEDIKKGSVLMLLVDDAKAERASASSVTIME